MQCDYLLSSVDLPTVLPAGRQEQAETLYIAPGSSHSDTYGKPGVKEFSCKSPELYG